VTYIKISLLVCKTVHGICHSNFASRLLCTWKFQISRHPWISNRHQHLYDTLPAITVSFMWINDKSHVFYKIRNLCNTTVPLKPGITLPAPPPQQMVSSLRAHCPCVSYKSIPTQNKIKYMRDISVRLLPPSTPRSLAPISLSDANIPFRTSL
jgi:hypothetical protein